MRSFIIYDNDVTLKSAGEGLVRVRVRVRVMVRVRFKVRFRVQKNSGLGL